MVTCDGWEIKCACALLWLIQKEINADDNNALEVMWKLVRLNFGEHLFKFEIFAAR